MSPSVSQRATHLPSNKKLDDGRAKQLESFTQHMCNKKAHHNSCTPSLQPLPVDLDICKAHICKFYHLHLYGAFAVLRSSWLASLVCTRKAGIASATLLNRNRCAHLQRSPIVTRGSSSGLALGSPQQDVGQRLWQIQIIQARLLPSSCKVSSVQNAARPPPPPAPAMAFAAFGGAPGSAPGGGGGLPPPQPEGRGGFPKTGAQGAPAQKKAAKPDPLRATVLDSASPRQGSSDDEVHLVVLPLRHFVFVC